MNRRLTAYVTEEDIALGSRFSSTGCPIALALKRVYPNLRISLDGITLAVWAPYLGQSYYTVNAEARSFIDRFDKGETVRPAGFDFWKRGANE